MNELRGLRDVHEKLRQVGASLVAISNEDAAISRKLVADEKLPFPILRDADESFFRRIGMLHEHAAPGGANAARPATFVLDRDAKITWMRADSYIRTRPDPLEVVNAVR